MVKHATTLDDKYTQTEGRVFMSSVQALVRLPLVQKRRDAAAGLNTAGFITGYRGSPIGVYDAALWGAKKHLKENEIEFLPGVNEELAAASLRGAQQLHWFENPKYDGVFSIWYAKMLGVDRAHEALKMGNLEGAAKHGGVLIIAADDHGGKSSATAQGSEQSLVGAMMPVLYPANTQEFVEYGLLGIALSRFSGLWVGFKCTNDTLEATSSVSVDSENLEIVEPDDVDHGNGLNILQPEIMPLPQEKKVIDLRLPAARAFAKANKIDRVVLDSRWRRLGIITAGKAYLDVLQALSDIGIDEKRANELGIRLYKVGMIWPLEPDGLKDFVRGHEEILVIEEKRPIMEEQIVSLLYNETDPKDRPRIVGKSAPNGQTLIPATGETSPALVLDTIMARLEEIGVADKDLAARIPKRKEEMKASATIPPSTLFRMPYFCSGCPHNTSTNHPDGTVNYAGVGCHALAHFMPQKKTSWAVQMGAEGALWVGMHRFTDIPHVFQNLGDGTYFHSGSLAIRAAVASGANMTYKLLYNDAIAMTGGQPIDGTLTVDMMARQVSAEGVRRVVLVTDEPDKYPANAQWPPGLTIRHRSELNEVQEELAATEGVTAIIYDQTCAAEKRRRRKRGLMIDPDKRVFINKEVCEGCGDCSEKSNCLSVQPIDTPFGRKRMIDQSSCNKDFSCVNGFCPSFVTISGAEPKKAVRKDASAEAEKVFAALPAPAATPLSEPQGVLITGVGGTGVLTVGAILAMAAHLEGKGCSVMDMTGMAQKGGSVLSHLRIAPSPDEIYAPRIGPASSSLIIGCDLVVTAGMEAMQSVRKGHTEVVVNSNVTPTAQFQQNSDVNFEPDHLLDNVRTVAGDGRVHSVGATNYATSLIGDSIATNLFMVGFAFQKGLLPLSLESIEQAIGLNGVAVDMNIQAFNWGRVAAQSPQEIEPFLNNAASKDATSTEIRTLDDLIAHRVGHLTGYQNEAYARRFKSRIDALSEAENSAVPGSQIVSETAARVLSKIMSYKDEYEVARLYSAEKYRRDLKAAFDGDLKIKLHLAPPLLSKRDPSTGHLQKREFGAWIFNAFRILSWLKGLRGGAFDIFGYTAERKMERALIVEVEKAIDQIADRLTAENIDAAAAWLSAYDDIRGYGHVKEANLEKVRARLPELEQAFINPRSPVAIAAE